MDIAGYKALVPNTPLTDAQITAAITRTQAILENLLGFTLDTDKIDDNEFPGLTPIKAFRIFPFNKSDEASRIDPCLEVHSVYFLREDGTTEEAPTTAYNARIDRGLISYLSFYNSFLPFWPAWLSASFINFTCSELYICSHIRLLVDADWVWDTDWPNDLLMVWADMITYYADDSRDIRSQTLGSHSYTKFDKVLPEYADQNASIIARYAGPKGTAIRTLTI